MRLSKEDIDAKIIALYKSGWSFRPLQKRYHKSPNYIAKLVKGIEVKCSACGQPKGKGRFHAYHPDRVKRPDYTILLCPSCYAKERAKLKREEEKSQVSGVLSTTENTGGKLSTAPPTFPPGPISPTGKKVLIGVGIALVTEALFPGFFERRWKEIKDHWQMP
jgi:hypothetical protein